MRPRGGPSVAIIGPGRVGQALAKLLAEAGVQVDFVAARRIERARRAQKFIGRGQAVTLTDPALARASVFVLTVSDRALAPVAEQLASLLAKSVSKGKSGKPELGSKPLAGRIFLHTCGSLDASVLKPLGRLGGAMGSLHPFQTVPSPKQGARNLLGTFWTIPRTRDPSACRLARG